MCQEVFWSVGYKKAEMRMKNKPLRNSGRNSACCLNKYVPYDLILHKRKFNPGPLNNKVFKSNWFIKHVHHFSQKAIQFFVFLTQMPNTGNHFRAIEFILALLSMIYPSTSLTYNELFHVSQNEYFFLISFFFSRSNLH